MADSIKYYSVEDLETIIKPLKDQLKLNEGELSVRMGYNSGYIAQVKSRGQIPPKLIQSIRKELLLLRKATSDEESSIEKAIENLTISHRDDSESLKRLIHILEVKYGIKQTTGMELPPKGTHGRKTRIPEHLKEK